MAKILLVDDQAEVRDAYEELLTSEGYEVDVALDGSEAIQKLAVGGYDLVLLDLLMPPPDGFAVLQSLKSHPPEKPVGPVIVLTNLSRDPLLQKAIKLGANSCIIKSNEAPNEVLAKIKTLLLH